MQSISARSSFVIQKESNLSHQPCQMLCTARPIFFCHPGTGSIFSQRPSPHQPCCSPNLFARAERSRSVIQKGTIFSQRPSPMQRVARSISSSPLSVHIERQNAVQATLRHICKSLCPQHTDPSHTGVSLAEQTQISISTGLRPEVVRTQSLQNDRR
jgi:hypothetical protein